MKIDVDALARLRIFVAKYPNLREAAKALGVSHGFVYQMLTQRLPVSERILRQLGLRRTIVEDTRPRRKADKADAAEELAS